MSAAVGSMWHRQAGRLADVALLVGALLALWQVVHHFAGATAMTAPLQTFRYTFGLVISEGFWLHVYATGTAFLLAMLIAAVAGLAIGALLGSHRLADDVAEPILSAAYSIPKVTLYPVILLFFGLGLAAQVAFGVFHGIVPITLFTMNAVRNINPVLLKTGRSFGLGPWELVHGILFPAALPEIMTGLRIGFSVTFIGTLLSEMFGSKAGLGFLLMRGLGINDVDLIMALTLLLVTFASITNTVLVSIERRLCRYMPRSDIPGGT